MVFKVSDSQWLKTEGDRVQALILMPKFWHRAWTPESLKGTLNDLGLGYSMPDVLEINDELHQRGIVEDVPE